MNAARGIRNNITNFFKNSTKTNNPEKTPTPSKTNQTLYDKMMADPKMANAETLRPAPKEFSLPTATLYQTQLNIQPLPTHNLNTDKKKPFSFLEKSLKPLTPKLQSHEQ